LFVCIQFLFTHQNKQKSHMENSLPQTPNLSSVPADGAPAVPPQKLYNPGWIPVGLVCIGLGIITGFATVFSDSVALSFFNSLAYVGVFLSLFLTFQRLEQRYPVQRLRIYFLVMMILYGVMCLFSGADEDEDFVVGLLLLVLVACADLVFLILTGVELRKAAKIMPAEFGFGNTAGVLLIIFTSATVFFGLIAGAIEEEGEDVTALWFLQVLVSTGYDVVFIILITQVNRLFDRRPAIAYPPYSPTQPAAAPTVGTFQPQQPTGTPVNPSVVPAPQGWSNAQWLTFGKICGIITICLGVGNWLIGKFTDDFSLPIYLPYTGMFIALYIIFSQLQTRYPVRRLNQFFLILLIVVGVLGLTNLLEYAVPSPDSNSELLERIYQLDEDSPLRERLLNIEASESSSDWSSIINGFSMFLLFPIAALSILCGVEYQKLAKLYPKEMDFGYGKSLGKNLVIVNSIQLVLLLLLVILIAQDNYNRGEAVEMITLAIGIPIINGYTWYAYCKPLMELKDSVFLKQEY
uniref:hypothetical protein n=1 Tax=uncultured Rikenella sp. TaxID=368003 RepID=UPI00260BEC1D